MSKTRHETGKDRLDLHEKFLLNYGDGIEVIVHRIDVHTELLDKLADTDVGLDETNAAQTKRMDDHAERLARLERSLWARLRDWFKR